MLSFLRQYAKNYFASQNGEEGILIEVVMRLSIDEGFCVETGGANGLFCSNTALLLKDHLWRGLFVEANYSLHLQCKQNWAENPRVRSQCSRVDSKNVNAFVGHDCDLLSLDTDGSDYEIFKGLNAKPKIVIIEIDSSIPPGDEGFNSDGGASYRSAVRLGIDKGYFLLCHTGNIILIANEYRYLFPDIIGDGLTNSEEYFNTAWIPN
jgi:hypothetical protein